MSLEDDCPVIHTSKCEALFENSSPYLELIIAYVRVMFCLLTFCNSAQLYSHMWQNRVWFFFFFFFFLKLAFFSTFSLKSFMSWCLLYDIKEKNDVSFMTWFTTGLNASHFSFSVVGSHGAYNINS